MASRYNIESMSFQVRLRSADVNRMGSDLEILGTNITIGTSAFEYIQCGEEVCDVTATDRVVLVCLDDYMSNPWLKSNGSLFLVTTWSALIVEVVFAFML